MDNTFTDLIENSEQCPYCGSHETAEQNNGWWECYKCDKEFKPL